MKEITIFNYSNKYYKSVMGLQDQAFKKCKNEEII